MQISKDKKRRRPNSANSNKKKRTFDKSSRPGSDSRPGSKPNNSSKRSGPKPDRRNGGRGPQRKSNIDPLELIKKAQPTEIVDYVAERTISELPIAHKLKNNLLDKGFEKPSEIQDKSLESLLDGRDILGIAQTGTGKTAAFLIPIIDKLLREDKPFHQALIVVPTRELATQVEDEFRSMSKGLKLYSSCFIGGTNINRDLNSLRRPSHVVIGTPGRLLDLVDRRKLHLHKFNTLVLDEFDRMLDMGFIHDVKRILSEMEHRKHSMLFSATLDQTQKGMISTILKDPVTVQVSSGTTSNDHIEQDIIKLSNGEDKFDVLMAILGKDECERVLLFDETKHRVNRLCQKLNKKGVQADAIHGNKSQNARQNALNDFKAGKIRVLVATDVAARGIDVDDVTHVINYQLPQTMDSYIHRVGRTGRAGKKGKAFTFVN